MNWLLHNPIADLPGPLFLLFYGFAIVAVLMACRQSVRAIDRTGDLDPPEIPTKLDPYEIAYLRGGEREVARVALQSLIDRGLFKRNERRDRSLTKGIVFREIIKGRDPEPGELASIEATVLNWSGFPASQSEILHFTRLPATLKSQCIAYEQYLTDQQLLAPNEMKLLGNMHWWIGASIIMGIGGYKLAVAMAKGHGHVAFLLVMAVIGTVALAPACLAFPRTSRRGQKYLTELGVLYSRLKSQFKATGHALADDSLAGDHERLPESPAAQNTLLLGAIFGSVALADTLWTGRTRMLYCKPTTDSGGGCGGGTMAGCGGGGGGGGCGGGGCGGCGGCGG